FSVVSRLSPYRLYKLILPLGLLTTPVSLYVISQPLLKSRGWRLLAAISPLAFPVVLQEMLISRPQSIFLICFVPILFLLGRLSLNRRQPGNLYWLLASVLIGVVGLAIHTLFAFIVAAGLLSLVVFYWPNIIQRPIESLLIFLGIGVAFYPWISRAGIVGDAIEIGRLFAVTARHSHFRLWFLSHYRNADGNEVGWPGILAIFYYGYNLGLLMIGLLGILALPAFFRRRPWRGLNAGQLWPAWLSLAFFGFIAEVAPRFGFAFLPDRAWLFIALSFSLLMPYVLARLVNQPFKRKIYPIFLVSLALLSLIAGWAIGYGKSGWIVSADYPAAAFINAKLSPDAVILSQGTNHVLVRYFAQRLMVRPMTNIFLSSDPNAVQDYLDRQESDYARVRSVNLDERHRLGNELRQIDSAYPNAAASDQLILRIERAAIESEFLSLATAEKQLRLTYPTVNAPIYILYSRNKDQTLYASRSWWRSSNFFGADLAKFTVRYPIIYNQGGVTIWQVTH
ncbi:MAG TPA: hypothetical protein VLE93_00045, partial [Candidatus Saccharimonadales bacterium]|nr:hypothetical protein [Candidatus Saccharimonadales bacterium]